MVPTCTDATKVEGAGKDGICQCSIPAPPADASILAGELLFFCAVSWGKWVYAQAS